MTENEEKLRKQAKEAREYYLAEEIYYRRASIQNMTECECDITTCHMEATKSLKPFGVYCEEHYEMLAHIKKQED